MKKLVFATAFIAPLAYADYPVESFQEVVQKLVKPDPDGRYATILSTTAIVKKSPEFWSDAPLIPTISAPIQVALWEDDSNITHAAFAISTKADFSIPAYYVCEDLDINQDQPIEVESFIIECSSLVETEESSVTSFVDNYTYPMTSMRFKSLRLEFFNRPKGTTYSTYTGPFSERFRVVERTYAMSFADLHSISNDRYEGAATPLVQEYASNDFTTSLPLEVKTRLGSLPASTSIFYTSIHLPYGDDTKFDIPTLKKKYEITASAVSLNGYSMPLFNFYTAPTSTDLHNIKMIIPYSFPSGDFEMYVTIKEKTTGKQITRKFRGNKDY